MNDGALGNIAECFLENAYPKLLALPKGQKRLLIGDPDGVRALRERWMAMSEEERVSATETAYQEAVARIKAHSGKTTRQIGNIQRLVRLTAPY